METDNITIEIEISGKKLNIDGKYNTSAPYKLMNVEGLSASDYEIELTSNGSGNGGRISGKRVAERIITIECKSVASGKNADEEYLIGFFTPFETGRMTINKYGTKRYITIDIRSFKINRKQQSNSLKFQAIFLCADPFFHDVDQHGENMASKTNLIRAPLVFTKGNFVASIKRYKLEARVNNPGHKETGLIISIIARGDVDQPRIDNLTNGQYISVNTKMKNKDVLVINTIKGETGITLNGTNITHLKDRKSRFFQMLSGDNILKYSAMTGYIYMDVSPRWGAEFLGI